MDTASEDRVRSYWIGVWGDGDFEVARSFYAPSFRMNGVEMTPSGFAESAGSWREHFIRFDVEVLMLVGCGDTVVSRTRYTVTPSGAAGTSVITGIDIFEFDGDLVRDHWHETDHTLFVTLVAASDAAASA